MTTRPSINELENIVAARKANAARLRRIADAAVADADAADRALEAAEDQLSREQDRIDTDRLDYLDAAERAENSLEHPADGLLSNLPHGD